MYRSNMSTPRKASDNPREPYGSVMDLPSFRELARGFQGADLLTRVVARDQRAKIQQRYMEFQRLAQTVDDFYERLGPRNWIFHELMNVERIEKILRETETAEEAEAALIKMYQDTEATGWWLLRLPRHEALRARMAQIERAREHYNAGQFSSCAFHLIAVMDGFVNDFEADKRRGLAARDADEMFAWDSVVGHHQGLTHVMKTFTASVKKRRDEEVFDLYRHGIMHGSMTNFDNPVVATKAWNMLFALVDWANARQQEDAPKPAKPTWKDTIGAIRDYGRWRQYRQNFAPQTVLADESTFADHEPVKIIGSFLTAWQSRRWSEVARHIPRSFTGTNKSLGAVARDAREIFDPYPISSWSFVSLAYNVPAAAAVTVKTDVDGKERTLTFRLMVMNQEDKVDVPGSAGSRWELLVWAPSGILRDEE